jgi:chromosome condensin MukBEF MukE localization factor
MFAFQSEQGAARFFCWSKITAVGFQIVRDLLFPRHLRSNLCRSRTLPLLAPTEQISLRVRQDDVFALIGNVAAGDDARRLQSRVDRNGSRERRDLRRGTVKGCIKAARSLALVRCGMLHGL